MPDLHNLFDKQASHYALARPHYPDVLFAYLSSLAPHHNLAWDCATGSGQAAMGLAPYFNHIVATDVSAAQLAHAKPHAKIEYRVGQAENPPIEDHSVDLVTVAIAIHWFNRPLFYQAVQRVLVPHGVLAVWAYNQPYISPEIDRLMRALFYDELGPYWPPGRELVDLNYETIDFPFPEIAAPHFCIEEHWDFNRLLGYVHSWSALERYIQTHQCSPLPQFEDALRAAWGNPDEARRIRFPIFLKVGYTK